MMIKIIIASFQLFLITKEEINNRRKRTHTYNTRAESEQVRRKGDVKKAMRLLITLLLLMCHSCVRSLPIQSQALENIDDQFFWQQAWFDDKPDSPFLNSDGKKITAKSIFILPSFEKKATPYCPPDYLIDNIGKCIKIVSSHKSPEEILASRLINLIPTSDANSFYDYEYDDTESQSTNDDQLSNLPALVPILNENNGEDESKSTATSSSESSSVQYFRDDEKNQTSLVEVIITTLSSHDENDTMTYETTQFDDGENSTTITQDETPMTTVSGDVDIYEQSTDATISESSDTINFDADNAFLLNDSLIIANDKNSSFDASDYSELLFTTMEPMEIFVEQNQHLAVQNSTEENSENSQSTSTEVTQPSRQEEEEETSTLIEQKDYGTKVPSTMMPVDLDSTFKYSESPDNDDRQNENKFVYHHLREPATTTMPAAFANKLLRFPSSTEQQRQRVRFPDDDEIFTARQTPVSTSRPSSSFSWPRESNTQNNNGGAPGKSLITKFWNQQPLITDYNARGNSKNYRMGNVLPFARKVLTPPHQYNYRK